MLFRSALKVDQELIDLGVSAIIGHYLSTVSLQVTPLLNKNKMVMISTAASTTDLAGVDDFFFRLVLSNKQMGASLGNLCFKELKLKTVVIVYDLSNPGYSNSFSDPFKSAFEQNGGRIVAMIPFNQKKKFSAPDIVKEVIASNADGVCLVTNAINGALICQHLKKNNSSMQIVASGWTYSDPNFISVGGKAVNGVVSVNEYNGDSENEDFKKYKKKFESRFGEESTHPDKIGYEAAQILLTALSKNNDPSQLKETLLKTRNFDLCG